MGIQYAQAMKGNVKKGMSPRPGQQTPKGKAQEAKCNRNARAAITQKRLGTYFTVPFEISCNLSKNKIFDLL